MDEQRRRKRRNVHRRRRRRQTVGLAMLAAMLFVLLLVSVSAIGFVAFIYWNDMLPSPSLVQVFAGTDGPIAAWGGNDPYTTTSWTGDDGEAALPVEPGQEMYAAFSFYISANAEYYVMFHEQNPQLSAEEVVWKVNALLHIPFYSYIRFNHDSNPLLVNPSHRLPYGFVPTLLVPLVEANPDLVATPETVAAFVLMRDSAAEEGLNLMVVSAYRSATRQAELFAAQSGDGVVARPYHSEHQTGRALDLWGPGPGGLLDGGGGPPSPTGLWVRENAHTYGFIVRYTAENTHITGFISEPWHITYVGVDISTYMHENEIGSLEEFVAKNPSVRLTAAYELDV